MVRCVYLNLSWRMWGAVHQRPSSSQTATTSRERGAMPPVFPACPAGFVSFLSFSFPFMLLSVPLHFVAASNSSPSKPRPLQGFSSPSFCLRKSPATVNISFFFPSSGGCVDGREKESRDRTDLNIPDLD